MAQIYKKKITLKSIEIFIILILNVLKKSFKKFAFIFNSHAKKREYILYSLNFYFLCGCPNDLAVIPVTFTRHTFTFLSAGWE